MKLKFKTLIVAILITSTLNAQNSLNKVLSQRISGNRFDKFTNGQWELSDSNNLVYSGNRGGLDVISSEFDVKYEYSGNGTTAVNQSRYTNTWNLNGLLAVSLEESWDGTSWQNATKNSYTYDINNRVLSRTTEVWISSSWSNSYRVTYTYNSSGFVLSEVDESGSGTTWSFTTKDLYVYDINNNNLDHTTQSWQSGWADVSKYISTFTQINKLASVIYLYDNGFGLANVSRATYNYDVNGNLISSLLESWNGIAWDFYKRSTYTIISNHTQTKIDEIWVNSSWVNDYKINYTYDTNFNELTDISSRWLNGAWVKKVRFTNTWNAANFIITNLKDNFDTISASWIPVNRTNYTRDTNNNTLIQLDQNWVSSNWLNASENNFLYNSFNNITYFDWALWNGSSWGYINRTFNYYEPYNAPTLITKADAKFSIDIFPNPVINEFTIRYDPKSKGKVNMYLANMLGQQIITRSFNPNEIENQFTFNITDIAKGVYILSLVQGDFSAQFKLIKN